MLSVRKKGNNSQSFPSLLDDIFYEITRDCDLKVVVVIEI